MKIRTNFVSNSSSTSFLIITKTLLTEEMLLGKMRKYFSILNGTHAYYKIMARVLDVFFERGKKCIIERDRGNMKQFIEKGFKFTYRGESTCLNQDNWASIEDRVIDPHIYICDKDFFMVSDEDY